MDYNEILNRFVSGTVSDEEKPNALQQLRELFTNSYDGLKELTDGNKNLVKETNDLTLSNSKLFRQLNSGTENTLQPKPKEKTFSESITIEDLEKL
jgi:uncharacterized tellurite resistance protein B-like protein